MSSLEDKGAPLPSLGTMMNKTQRLVLGLFVLLLVDIIWVSSSELTKYIYHNENYEKPFFSTYIKTSMFTLYLLGLCLWPPWRQQCSNKAPPYVALVEPMSEDENFYTDANTSLSDSTFVPIKTPEREQEHNELSGTESDDGSVRSVRFSKLAEVRQMSESGASEALLSRLSYQASVRAGEVAKRVANRLPTEKVARIALMFCLLWFVANYSYQLALAQTEAAIVTVMSFTSSLFTLILAAIFPANLGDRFSLSKLLAVCLSIGGVIIVCLSDRSIETKVPTGAVLALFSAFFYAAYLVFLRRKVDNEDKIDIPLFFGFVGLFNLVLLWPLLLVLHYSGLEPFQWPTQHQWMSLVINGLIGTVLSEVLWLWGCFLTSSLIATVAISLTFPMSMIADVLLKQVSYSYLFYAGTVPMFLAFFAVTLLAHYENWDPVMIMIRKLYKCICRKKRPAFRLPDLDEQTEALIGINADDHEA